MKLLTILLALLLAFPLTSMADCVDGPETVSQQSSHDCCDGDTDEPPPGETCDDAGACANCGMATPTAIAVSADVLNFSPFHGATPFPEPGLPPVHEPRLLRPPIC